MGILADTSLEALEHADTAYWRNRILKWLRARGGRGTLWQACAEFGKPKNALSGRFSELRDACAVRDSGVRLRDPSTGVSARVWEVCEVQELQQARLF